MTTQLIPVFQGNIQQESTQLVDARILHEYLEVDTHFKDWIVRRINEYEFVENIDFIAIAQKRALGHGRGRKEYHITLDMAKELSMIERTEKGRQARKYFIACEKKLLNQIAVKPIEQIHHITLTDTELYNLTWLYKAADHMVSNLPKITPALYAIKSEYASLFNTMAQEHKWVVEDAKKIIINITKHIDQDNFKWRTVLPKLRNQF